MIKWRQWLSTLEATINKSELIQPKGRRLGLRPLLIGAGVLLLLAFIFSAYTRQAPDQLEMGKPAPDFTLSDLSGAPVQLSQLRGRTVLVTFWRTD